MLPVSESWSIESTILVYRDALVTSTINCATSVLAGFVVFSTLGHMADVSDKTVEEVIDNKGKWKMNRILTISMRTIRFGIGLHCLSTYNCIDGLVEIMGDTFLFYVDYFRDW